MFGYKPITEIVTTFTKIFEKLGDVVKMAQNATKQGERINPLTCLVSRSTHMRAEQTGAVCTEAKTIIDKGGCFKPSNTLTRVIANQRHRRFRCFFFNFRFADIF